jgi:serine protease Do
MKRILILLIALCAAVYYAQTQGYINLPGVQWLKKGGKADFVLHDEVRVLHEESAIISAIERSLPSVVTVTITKTTRTPDRIQIDPFNPESPFRRQPGEDRKIDGNIGSGFAITQNLVITNRHVVSDTEASYSILTSDSKTYNVTEISRDPLNDLAILKVDTSSLKPIELGDSSNLKLGQTVIAIGTPLGEFTNTVTSGIVSGLGRGITAGAAFEGYVERLDNVIQTDAAINPGNSGGPLLNTLGEVVGVNTAVSQGSQNIGFAIPVSVVKELVSNFQESGGKISRPYIGVRYQMISKENAILNEVPEGAYVVEVVPGSPADKAGLQHGDIITEFDNTRVHGTGDTTLQKLIAKRNVKDRVRITYWRDGTFIAKELSLEPLSKPL